MRNPNDRKRILAVDGGGSKTTLAVAEVDPSNPPPTNEFSIIGRVETGPSNPRTIGFDQTFERIASALNEARQQMGLVDLLPHAACISLAGAGRSEEQRTILAWARQLPIAEQVIVVDDVEPLRFAARYESIRLEQSQSHCAESWERCMTLVVGTGSIALGHHRNELSARSGGWGYLLGDEGSGFAIGLAALRSLCKTHDRGNALSPFQEAILHRLELDDPTRLIHWVYQSPLPRPAIAQLAQIVLPFAEHDRTAKKITNQAVSGWVKHLRNIAHRLDFGDEDYALALSGGILKHQPNLVQRLLRQLALERIAPRISHLIEQPIYGPLMMAWQGLEP